MSTQDSKRRAPRMMQVAPILTDPSMRNEKSGAKPTSEQLLREMGEDSDDFHKSVFKTQGRKTKEEQEAEEVKKTSDEGTSTLLIIVFALIVIALVALVVWMVLKQNEAKDADEEELKARLRPHQRNGMPPMGIRGPNGQPIPPHIQQQMIAQRHAMAQHQQQHAAQQAMAHVQAQQQAAQRYTMEQQAADSKVDPEELGRDDAIQAQQQQRMRNIPTPKETNNEMAAPAPLAKEVPEMPPAADTRNSDHKPISSQAELDEILSKTNAMLDDNSELTDTDRNMLNKFAQEAYSDDDEDEDEE